MKQVINPTYTKTLNCRGQLVVLDKPAVMGIVNLTPDSFYDPSRKQGVEEAIQQAVNHLDQGAMWLDLGAVSTRPGAEFVSEQEEMDRLLPTLEALRKERPEALISIDTFRASVAKTAIDLGADMINDVTAGSDPDLFQVVAAGQVPLVMMHSRGNPQNMQSLTQYDHLVEDILLFFSERCNQARACGVMDILVDPGFGFAKTVEQNFALMRELHRFEVLNRAILVGISRKSMIYKTLNTDAAGALNGTTALLMFALQKGAHILRVHDVKPAMECIALHQHLQVS